MGWFRRKNSEGQWAEKAAAAGLTFRFVERNTNGTYVTLAGQDPEQAKAFLREQTVTDRLFYIVVETPDGNWGADVKGLYLERLRPWQLDVSSGDCRVPAGAMATDDVQAAARGSVDNFAVWVDCGRCGHHWIDGVRYQNVTAVRCSQCAAKNLVDSSNIVVYEY